MAETHLSDYLLFLLWCGCVIINVFGCVIKRLVRRVLYFRFRLQEIGAIAIAICVLSYEANLSVPLVASLIVCEFLKNKGVLKLYVYMCDWTLVLHFCGFIKWTN